MMPAPVTVTGLPALVAQTQRDLAHLTTNPVIRARLADGRIVLHIAPVDDPNVCGWAIGTTALVDPQCIDSSTECTGDTIHEFGHLVQFNAFDDGLQGELDAAWAARHPYRYDAYAVTNAWEWWAEGTRFWYTAHQRNEIKRTNPLLAALLAQVYGDGDTWRISCTFWAAAA